MAGELSQETLAAILDTIPTGINFADENEIVRYRSSAGGLKPNPERIGGTVQECHSEASVPLVNQVISDLKSGKRDKVEAWKDRNGRKIYYRYFPVRNKSGKFIGTLEVVEDITDIQKITGEKKEIE